MRKNGVQHNLGKRSGGDIVELTLSHSANVRLLDSSNFQKYRNGRRHVFYGGFCERSPVRISIPNSGHWYVAVDSGGYAGTVGSSVRVLSQ